MRARKRFVGVKYTITHTKAFKKQFKKLHEKDRQSTLRVLETLANGETLAPKYKDHALQGKFANCRDCHIRPDLVLVYRYNNEYFELVALCIGSHSEIF